MATIGRRLFERLENGPLQVSVHSAFEHAINVMPLMSDDNELFTILSFGMDCSPLSVVTELFTFDDLALRSGMTASVGVSGARFSNEALINFADSDVWECRFPERAYSDILRNNLPVIQNMLNLNGKRGGMLPDEGLSPFASEMSLRLRNAAENLQKSIISDNELMAYENAMELVGLGFGLTPSGDDYLSGLLLTLHIPNSPFNKFIPFSRQVLEDARTKTNEISLQELSLSATGQARGRTMNFLSACISGSMEEAKSTLTKLLKIGSLSGTDIAFGITDGLKLYSQITCNQK